MITLAGYLRFAVPENDLRSGRAMGLFTAGLLLVDEGRLYDYEVDRRNSLMRWFSTYLAVPALPASDSNQYANPNAISWFKSSSTLHISKMRAYVAILAAHDVQVNQLMTERPGKIVYEDKYQVAAVPFKDTF